MKKYSSLIVAALFVLLGANLVWATPPTTQSRYIGFSNVQDASATVSWINGNGTGRVVVISEDATFIAPSESADYHTTDGSWTNKIAISGGNDYVIGWTTGTLRKVDLTGLTANTKYYIRIYEYNGEHGSYQFNESTATNNPRSFTTKPASLQPPTGLSMTAWSEGGILSWTDADNAEGYYLTIYASGSAIPEDGYDNLDIGKPSPANFPILGLDAGGTYRYMIASYDANNNRSSAATGTWATLEVPAISSISYTPNANWVKIGGTVTLLLTATNNQIGLRANGITVNGVDCASTLLDNGNGTYTVKYTVVSTNTFVADGSNLPLSIKLKDGKDVSSAEATGSGNALSAPGIDANYPSATITAPLANSWSTTAITTITGAATDNSGSGVSSVQVAIWIDNDKNGTFNTGDFYWNGSAWTATDVTWRPASVTTGWTYAISIPVPTTGYNKYSVQTKTTDVAGNVATGIVQNFFIYNNNEVWVDDSYITTAPEGLGYLYFTTIQSGITGVAETGTVNVAAGNYTEQVLIQKSLTLTGAGAESTFVKAPAGTRATFPGITGVGVNWNSDYVLAAYPTDWVGTAATGTPIQVKVSGFTFDANGQTTSADRFTGVFFGCVQGTNYTDAGLFNSKVTGFPATYNSATGVRVLGNSKLKIDNNTVDYTINGIAIYGDNAGNLDPDVEVFYNTVTYLQTVTTDYDEAAIFTAFGAKSKVDHNTVPNGLNGITLSYANGCTISNNTLSNITAHASGTNGQNMGWAITADNTSSNNTISGNTVTSSELGIWVSNGSNNNTITGNTITGNLIGIQVDKSSSGAAPTGLQFHGNKISDNSVKGFVNNTTVTADATCNWWGTENAYSINEMVSGNVQFLPFLVVNAGGTSYPWDLTNKYSCTGLGPVVNTTRGLSYMKIQTAIDSANTNDSITVAAGGYTEQVLIQKSLTLTGAGATTTIVKAPTGTRATFPGITGVGHNWVSDYVLAAYPMDWVGSAATGTPIQVKVSGFTFDANQQTHTTGAVRFTGVFFGCVKGTNYADAGLFNSKVTGFPPTYNSATGVRVLGNSKLSIDNNTVEYTINGISIYGDLSDNLDPDVIVSNNTVHYLQEATTAYDEQVIVTAFGAKSVVDHNTAINGVNGIILSYANGCTISNNTLSNITAGVGSEASGLDMGWAIDVDNTSSNNIISGNTVTNSELGIWVSNGSNNNTITENTITGNIIGIQVDTYSSGAAPTGLQFHGNKISDNSVKNFVNNTTVTANATCNWWGTENAYSINEMVSGNVQFLPFLVINNVDGTSSYSWDLENEYSCTGLGPVVNTTRDLSYMKIQTAIDSANTNDSITVAAGNYTEQVLIQKNLTLTGAGAESTFVKAPTGTRATFPGITGVGVNWISDYVLAAYPTNWDGTAATGTPIQVKVSGFTFDANEQTTTANRWTGVFFGCVQGTNYADAGLFNSKVTGFPATYESATGVRVLGDSKLQIDHNTVHYTINGIAIYGDNSINTADPDVIVSNNTVTCFAAEKTGNEVAIMIAFGAKANINNNIIPNGYTGITLSSAKDGCAITSNTISEFAGIGIFIYLNNLNTVTSNTISGSAGDEDFPEGITILNGDFNTVSLNTISGSAADEGISKGILIENGNSNTVTSNTISGFNGDAIFIDYGNSNTVSSNTISNTIINSYDGIYVRGDDNTINKNTISGIHSGTPTLLGTCGWGIGIGEGGTNNLIGDGTLTNANDITGCDAGIVFYDVDNTNTAKGNKIYGNDPWGLGSTGDDPETIATIDATNNWWGDPSGPYHTTNTCGEGNAVSDSVTFSPWYYEAEMTTENGLATATIDPINDISTVSNTPVIIYTKTTFPTSGIDGFNDAVKVDGFVTSDVAFPTGAVVESIKWRNGGGGAWSSNLISTPYSITGQEFYLSDVLGRTPAMLKKCAGFN